MYQWASSSSSASNVSAATPPAMPPAMLPMKTVAAALEASALPQVQVSPLVAGASPSKNTSGEPEAMALGPCQAWDNWSGR